MALRECVEVGGMVSLDRAFALTDACVLSKALDDHPGGAGHPVTELGKGLAIKALDTRQLSHRGLVRLLRETAERHGIPYQLEVLNRGGTDASLIQRARGVVAVTTLSIPAHYLHTVNELAHQADIAHSMQLLARVLTALHAETWQARAQDT